MDEILPAALGAITGLVLGLTGAGGGIVAVPLLVLVMHLSLAQAAPISLLAVALGASLGMILGLRQGTVRYRAALLLATAGLLASPLGIYFASILPNAVLLALFSVLLAFQAWRSRGTDASLQRQPLPCTLNAQSGKFVWQGTCALIMSLTGLLTGFLSGLLGVGGGFILVPSLSRNTELKMQSITATSLMVLTLVSLGGLLHWSAGPGIEWQVGRPFVLGAICGMAFARLGSARMPEMYQRRLFAGLCMLACIAMTTKLILSN